MKIFSFLLGFVILIGSSGCMGPSAEEIALYKERQKQQQEERQKRLQIEKEAKNKEALQYIDEPIDNNTIYDLLEKNQGYLKKDIYETEDEYSQRKNNLKNKYFGHKFIFEYRPEYVRYNADSKKLFVSFKTFGFDDRIIIAKRLTFSLSSRFASFEEYRSLTADIPSKSDTVHIGYAENSKKIDDKYVLLKNDCSPEEAKNIHKNWGIRFIVNIDYDGEPYGGGSQEDKFAKTDMIIVYNKKTKEIYKVIY